MKLSNRSIMIKEIIHAEVCMGTFGVVETALTDFDKEVDFLKSEIERLKKSVTYWFDAVNDMDSDKAGKLINDQPDYNLESF